jgi:hypothetical protein
VIAGARNMAPNDVVYLGVPPVRIDLLRSADGIDAEQTIARAELVPVTGLVISIILLDDLITNKRAAGRPQDLADVALLERVRASRSKR